MVSFDRQGHVASVNQAFLHLTKLDSGKVQGLDEQAFEEVLRALCREPLSFSGIRGPPPGGGSGSKARGRCWKWRGQVGVCLNCV